MAFEAQNMGASQRQRFNRYYFWDFNRYWLWFLTMTVGCLNHDCWGALTPTMGFFHPSQPVLLFLSTRPL